MEKTEAPEVELDPNERMQEFVKRPVVSTTRHAENIHPHFAQMLKKAGENLEDIPEARNVGIRTSHKATEQVAAVKGEYTQDQLFGNLLESYEAAVRGGEREVSLPLFELINKFYEEHGSQLSEKAKELYEEVVRKGTGYVMPSGFVPLYMRKEKAEERKGVVNRLIGFFRRK